MRYLTVVPARGGSKRLPGKNIKKLGGKPLIYWTIEAARDAGLTPVVSTEDEGIASLVGWDGTNVISRPEELAQDDTTTGEVALHALKTYESRGYSFDAVVILHPTSPFRTAEHIKKAIEHFESTGDGWAVESAYALPRKSHPNFTFGDCAWHHGGYVLNGAIYIVPVYMLKESRSHHNDSCTLYVMDEISSIDIDDEFDWMVAEAVINEDKNPHRHKALSSTASAEDCKRVGPRGRDTEPGLSAHHLSRREGSLGPGDSFWDASGKADCPYC